MYALTEEGKEYLEEGLPEKNLVELLIEGPVSFDLLKGRMKNFSIAIQWAKKKGWVEVKGGKIHLAKEPKSFPEQLALEKISRGEKVDENILSVLIQRKLAEKSRKIEKEIIFLTEEMIKTRDWRLGKFRPYNVEVPGQKIQPGKKHIVSFYIQKIRDIFFDLGFKEASGPLIESSFWNFDALFVPQDHPGRELQDTFYMKNPKKCKLPDKNLVNQVKAAHENGGGTGSLGWRYKWSEEIAKQAVLRTHTTAVSIREMSKLTPPAKVFCIGKTFRNESIDYKHTAEFTQIEGIVLDENIGFRDLLGYLKEFYQRMGFKVRFRPAYFPYTEMSTEPEIYFEEKGEWIEMGGSGIFRPEMCKAVGIDVPVLAWGLGLERLIMLKMGMNDIRNFYYKNDLKLLREAVLWQ
ncbi:MAG: phenylalanine--tRNA ligase subunit alpha [Candidatus Aenigmarchaeota archaeon]|nr:phenylalanine--tRNA ligase subunit alpha [Candidatus Aenigmarchaeota archaeon]